MLEVKRNPGDRGVSRTGAAAATARVQDPLKTGVGPAQPSRPASAPIPVKVTGKAQEQTRLPVLVGEAHFKGTLPVDGLVLGQLGSGNGSLNVRQKSKACAEHQPELAGEISFRDMVRVNGYIAGTVYSEKGTLIVDASARLDANVEVGIAVIRGSVYGDIVAHQKVEIGPNARICGNIWTRSIEIKNGAIFEGVCKMIE